MAPARVVLFMLIGLISISKTKTIHKKYIFKFDKFLTQQQQLGLYAAAVLRDNFKWIIIIKNLHLISSFTFFSLNRRRIEKHMSQLVIHHPSHFYTFKVTNFHLASKKNLQAIVIIIKRHFWDDDDDIDTDLNFLTFFLKISLSLLSPHGFMLCCLSKTKIWNRYIQWTFIDEWWRDRMYDMTNF